MAEPEVIRLNFTGYRCGRYILECRMGDVASNLVRMRAAYMVENADNPNVHLMNKVGDASYMDGPDGELYAYLDDVGACLEMLATKMSSPKGVVEYARWYLSKDFERTYPVLVTRAACKAVLHKTRDDARRLVDPIRFEFGRD